MQRSEFVAALRTALMQIDDIQSLRRSPLLTLLVRDREPNPMSLQRTLIEGIESLKRAPDVHAASSYEILYYRYIEQLGQEELAYQLGMSVRQLRRKQADAIEYLANHLWERFHLGERVGNSRAGTSSLAISNREMGLEKELAWLQRGFPPEAGDVRAELTHALQAADTLAQYYRVVLRDRVPPLADRVSVPPAALRQALLAVLTCAITRLPGQEVEITAQPAQTGLLITVRQISSPPGRSTPQEHSLRELQTTSALLASFGAEVAVASTGPLEITIRFRQSDAIPVLLVEDNPDTRQLLERYAANSVFRIIATEQFTVQEIVTLAQNTGARAIILDIMMPDIDGWDILSQLRHHPATQGIPIVVHSILPQEQLALLLGAAKYLQKPVSRETFLQALQELTSRREQGSG